MAIHLEFINFVVLIEVIKEKYPGGWAACLEDHKNLIGGRVWYDEHLFRDGAMNPNDMGRLVEEWRELGFQIEEEIDGEKIFKDACVTEALFGHFHPCDWLIPTGDGSGAFLKGTDPGPLIGREAFQRD